MAAVHGDSCVLTSYAYCLLACRLVSPTDSVAWKVKGRWKGFQQVPVSHSSLFSCFSSSSPPPASLQAQCLLRERDRNVISSFFKHLFKAQQPKVVALSKLSEPSACSSCGRKTICQPLTHAFPLREYSGWLQACWEPPEVPASTVHLPKTDWQLPHS